MSTICGRRSLSGLSRCDQPTGHAGLHIDSAMDTSFQLHDGPHGPDRANPPQRVPRDTDVVTVRALKAAVADLRAKAVGDEVEGVWEEGYSDALADVLQALGVPA